MTCLLTSQLKKSKHCSLRAIQSGYFWSEIFTHFYQHKQRNGKEMQRAKQELVSSSSLCNKRTYLEAPASLTVFFVTSGDEVRE
jgi:hypothetical protein